MNTSNETIKKYYAKAIPIHSEAVEGNLNYDGTGRAYPDNNQIEENWSKIWKNNGKYYRLTNLPFHSEWEEIAPLKLVICSRDINEGDKVLVLQFNGDPNWEAIFISAENDSHRLQFMDKSGFFGCPPDGYVKLVSEIPSTFDWIEDGDEFTEEQIENILNNIKTPN